MLVCFLKSWKETDFSLFGNTVVQVEIWAAGAGGESPVLQIFFYPGPFRKLGRAIRLFYKIFY